MANRFITWPKWSHGQLERAFNQAYIEMSNTENPAAKENVEQAVAEVVAEATQENVIQEAAVAEMTPTEEVASAPQEESFAPVAEEAAAEQPEPATQEEAAAALEPSAEHAENGQGSAAPEAAAAEEAVEEQPQVPVEGADKKEENWFRRCCGICFGRKKQKKEEPNADAPADSGAATEAAASDAVAAAPEEHDVAVADPESAPAEGIVENGAKERPVSHFISKGEQEALQGDLDSEEAMRAAELAAKKNGDQA
jgi:hypothetical protein